MHALRGYRVDGRAQAPFDHRARRAHSLGTRGSSKQLLGFFPHYLRHAKGPLYGQPFQLDAWQKTFLRELYRRDQNGRRIYKRAVLGLPQGNGKTALAAGLALGTVALPTLRPLISRRLALRLAVAAVATFAGSALRLQAYAEKIRRPLPPLIFILGGEPITARKRALLENRGHRVYPWYGAVDAGRIAIGCLKPEAADDMHLLTDRFAAIDWQGRLLLTSLLPSVHKRYLNTDCGDLATLERRRCGCPLGELGLEFHLRDVRSVQKFCLEGITLPADLVHRLAEEVLPARCGGAP